jgi:hypothetical protein
MKKRNLVRGFHTTNSGQMLKVSPFSEKPADMRTKGSTSFYN